MQISKVDKIDVKYLMQLANMFKNVKLELAPADLIEATNTVKYFQDLALAASDCYQKENPPVPAVKEEPMRIRSYNPGKAPKKKGRK